MKKPKNTTATLRKALREAHAAGMTATDTAIALFRKCEQLHATIDQLKATHAADLAYKERQLSDVKARADRNLAELCVDQAALEGSIKELKHQLVGEVMHSAKRVDGCTSF